MIHTFLGQAAWRIRAYLSTVPDVYSAGWRRDPSLCPIAEWLLFETTLHEPDDEDCSKALDAPISVEGEKITWGGMAIATPMVLSLFIDLIDSQETTFFLGESILVSRDEALATLLQAEHQAAQRLLPERAESRARCDYAVQGQRCIHSAETPLVYAFLDMRDGAARQDKPERSHCQLFIGHLCGMHWLQVVFPPRTWWPANVETHFLESVEV